MSSPNLTPVADIGELARTYAVVREIGRGGMGSVVLARHREAHHLVAIKIAVRNEVDAESMARFAREARLMARLRHPNIVGLYDVTPIGQGRVGIVMEYVRGRSLARILDRKELLSLEASLRIVRDLGSALAHAHALGVIHRDVKPQNVLIEDGTGAAKLADFGIAKAIGDATDMTATGVALGTPAYMSPEQIDGGVLDVRTDIYSLGLLAWQLASGRRPWEGEALFTLLYKQKHEPLPSIQAMRPAAPPRLLLALEGALEKEPAARWETMAAMLEQLEQDRPTGAMLARRQRAVAMRRPQVAQATSEDATIPVRRGGLASASRPSAPGGMASDTDDGSHAATIPVRRDASAPPFDDGSAPSSAARPTPPASSSPSSSLSSTLSSSLAPANQRSFFGGLLVGGVGTLAIVFALQEPSPWRRADETLSSVPRSVDAAAVRSPVAPSSGEPRVASAMGREGARATARSGRRADRVKGDSTQRPRGGARPADASAFSLWRFLFGSPPRGSAGRTTSSPSPAARSDVYTRVARTQLLVNDSSARVLASALVDSAIALDPSNGGAYLVRARLHVLRGSLRDAWTDIELATRAGASWESLALTTALRARESGPRVARMQLAAAVSAAGAARGTLAAPRAVWLAAALAQVGDEAAALGILERADATDPRISGLLADPLLDPLRGTAPFEALRQRVAR